MGERSSLVAGTAAVYLGLLLSLSSDLLAQPQTETEEDFNRRQYADWTGVAFHCYLGNAEDRIQKQICDIVRADSKLLAATGKIPFISSEAKNSFQRFIAEMKIGKPLALEAHVSSTTGYQTAVYLSVRVTSFYNSAIDGNAASDKPQSKPRSGTLVIWERSFLGVGEPDRLPRELAIPITTSLKEFFAEFIQARN